VKLTTRFKFKLLEEDGTDHPGAYREAINALGNALDSLLYEPGDLRFTHRTTLTTGWLKPEGQQLLIATYKALYEGLGGAGNPSLTAGAETGKFFLPDYRERVAVGSSGTSALGSKGGVATVTLTGKQSGLKSHAHATTDPGHAHGVPALIPVFNTEFGADYFAGGNGNNGGFTSHATSGATTGISVNAVAASNAEEPHTNLQPYTVCNVWIRT
jgi:microcystin-dependent protein